MKKNILLPALFLLGITANAQEVLKIQNGASLTLQSGAEMAVLGGVTLDNGSMLTNNGTFTIKQNGASGAADFFDNSIATYSYGSGKFAFSSTVLHNIYSNNNFGRIDVDAAGLVLYSNITANKWWLNKGKVNTGNYKAIVLGKALTDLEAGPSNFNFGISWIIGNLRRYINTNEFYYLFPIGDGNIKNSIEMLNHKTMPLTGVQYLDVSFVSKPGTDAGLMATENGAQYIVVNPTGVWKLQPDNAPTGGIYHLKLLLNGFTGLPDNAFGILQRPLLSSNAAEWNVPAGSFLNPMYGAGRLLSDGYAMRNNLPIFGQFGIGIFTPNAALPVTLTNFDARRLSKQNVQIDWQTETESNNKGFYIERRLENEASFTGGGFVNSKAVSGNSNTTLHYNFTDNNSYGGITYYRLKQTDLDGGSYYSLIKAVKGTGNNSVSVMLWPNPNKGQFSIQLSGSNDNKEAVITDLQGKNVKRIIISGTQQVNINGLSAGVYILTIPDAFGKGENFKEKVMVVR